jgi:flagellar basal-body rod protein FlgC
MDGTKPAATSVFDISASALSAQRVRLSVIAQNIANANSTAKTAEGTPYRRQRVVFESVLKESKGRDADGLPVGSVRARLATDASPFQRVKRPGDPDADKEGWVALPNVNVIDEMVELIDASRTYEANLSALRSYHQMLQQTLEMAK